MVQVLVEVRSRLMALGEGMRSKDTVEAEGEGGEEMEVENMRWSG